jgi:hypothetical protein
MMIDRLWRRLRQQSHVRQRRFDTEVLGPQLRRQASGDLDAALCGGVSKSLPLCKPCPHCELG